MNREKKETQEVFEVPDWRDIPEEFRMMVRSKLYEAVENYRRFGVEAFQIHNDILAERMVKHMKSHMAALDYLGFDVRTPYRTHEESVELLKEAAGVCVEEKK